MPKRLTVVLTSRCFLNCVMCKGIEIPWDISKETVASIVRCMPFLESIEWTGGEVYFSKYFENLFDKASVYPDLHQQINSNGLLINEERAKKLMRKRVTIRISVDGFTKETYENIRRGAKFEKLLNNISLVAKYKQQCNSRIDSVDEAAVMGLQFMVMRSNYHEMEKAVDFAKEYKFDFVNFYPPERTFNEEDFLFQDDTKILSPMEKISSKIKTQAEECNMKYSNHLPVKTVSKDPEHFPADENEIEGTITCYEPWESMFVGPSNTIKPKCYCINDIPIKKRLIEEIWNSRAIQLYREKLLNKDYTWCNALCKRVCISFPAHSR